MNKHNNKIRNFLNKCLAAIQRCFFLNYTTKYSCKIKNQYPVVYTYFKQQSKNDYILFNKKQCLQPSSLL